MIFGFDYYHTLTDQPKVMSTLVSSLISEGHQIYIISARGKSDKATMENYRNSIIQFCNHHHITWHKLEIVPFESDFRIPDAKLAVCKRLGVQAYFDDRQDVCEILRAEGIISFQVHRVVC